MLIGLGGLGSITLELLAREEDLGRIVVGSRNAERGMARCNLTRLGAMAQGYAPSISFIPLDLNDKEAVAETVHREAPDVILSTATMQTWWLPDLLPPEQAAVIKSAGFGVWLPVHLTLTLKLMEALREADYRGITLTAPFPDVVNCVLGRLDLAPTCGVGNISQFVPKVRLLAAERLGTPLDAVRVLMVAHHALGPAVVRAQVDNIPPYFLRIEHGGQDVTEAICADQLLLAPYPRTIRPGEPFPHRRNDRAAGPGIFLPQRGAAACAWAQRIAGGLSPHRRPQRRATRAHRGAHSGRGHCHQRAFPSL